VLDQRSVWRAGWLIVAIVAIAALGRWILADGGSVIFTLIMSFLASVAIEPAVSRLSHHMKRGLATALTMIAVIVATILFIAIFGRLLADQITQLVRALPGLVKSATDFANKHFGTSLDPTQVLDYLDLSPGQIQSVVTNVAGGLLGVVLSVAGAFFSMFTFGIFTFYFSADAPRLRRWIARLFPAHRQEIVATVWDLAVQKTGGYVSARIVLATICGSLSAIFFLIIGLPYWLALGIWTGVVAQFVPTIGTYIAIAFPVLIGLLSSRPITGVLALAFALVYQQIENLTIEPQISAKAVDVHPAVSFASVMFGAALFGVAGALVAVPMAAMMLALFDIYTRKYELLPQLAEPVPTSPKPPSAPRQGPSSGVKGWFGRTFRSA
jgi:predicted PurR-regulated permease PerM